MICRSGEIGKRTALKMLRAQALEGSSPSFGTKIIKRTPARRSFSEGGTQNRVPSGVRVRFSPRAQDNMKKYFDLLITIGIIITALPAVILLYHKNRDKKSWEYKHKKSTVLMSTMLLFGTAILVYGSFIEPHLLVTNKVSIDLENLGQEIEIVLVTDMQVGQYRNVKNTEKIVERVISLNPDIVLLGGDQVDNSLSIEEELVMLDPLKKLVEKFPTFAIHGNHEYGIGSGKAVTDPRYRIADVSKEAKEKIESLEIKYLVNELETIKIDNQEIDIFGGDAPWSGNLNWKNINASSSTTPTIALIHNPVAALEDLSNYHFDLMLSGHTHGGQIRLPFLGPLGRIDNKTPAQWYQGLHDVKNFKLFVSSGTGESGTRARLFNPPEVVLITLK